jgi:hypothetical protein
MIGGGIKVGVTQAPEHPKVIIGGMDTEKKIVWGVVGDGSGRA